VRDRNRSPSSVRRRVAAPLHSDRSAGWRGSRAGRGGGGLLWCVPAKGGSGVLPHVLRGAALSGSVVPRAGLPGFRRHVQRAGIHGGLGSPPDKHRGRPLREPRALSHRDKARMSSAGPIAPCRGIYLHPGCRNIPGPREITARQSWDARIHRPTDTNTGLAPACASGSLSPFDNPHSRAGGLCSSLWACLSGEDPRRARRDARSACQPESHPVRARPGSGPPAAIALDAATLPQSPKPSTDHARRASQCAGARSRDQRCCQSKTLTLGEPDEALLTARRETIAVFDDV